MDHSMRITEAIFKERRPIADKIKLARYAWLSTACRMRGKYQSLVDWTCTQLDNASKANLDEQEVCLLWSFLEEALEALQHAQSSGGDVEGKLTVSPVLVKHRAAQVICRSITAGVDALLAGEALPGHLPAVLSCFNSLTSCPQLSPVVMNRAERLVELVVTLCTLVSALKKKTSHVDPSVYLQSQQLLCSLLHLFLAIQRQQANRKKIFLLAVEKLIGSLLPVYELREEIASAVDCANGDGADTAITHSLQDVSSKLASAIEDVLGATLFDKEHLSQIPSVLAMMSSSTSSDKVNGSPSPAKQKKKPAEAAATPQASVNKSTSHSHKLFATLQELVQSSAAAGDAQCYTWPSLFFQLYLTAARARSDRPAAADLPFFYQMIHLLDVPVTVTESDTAAVPALTLDKARCIVHLLTLVNKYKVYKVVDDKMSGGHHLTWFQHAVSWLVQAPVDHLVVCKALSVILDLNHRAVEEHLQSVFQLAWRSLGLSPTASATHSPANELVQKILMTYGKLGQLSRLVENLLPAASEVPFRGVPDSLSKSFASLVQLLAISQFSALWKGFSTYFTKVLDSLQKSCDDGEPQRKRTKASQRPAHRQQQQQQQQEFHGMCTGAALFSVFVSNVHIVNGSAAGAVCSLLQDTLSDIVVPLLEACRHQSNSASLLSSVLQVAGAIGQSAIHLYSLQGNGMQWSMPGTLLSTLVTPMSISTPARGGQIAVPTVWCSVVDDLQQLRDPGVLVQMRCLAAHWLHSQSLLSSQCGQCGGKAGRQNGTKKEQPMDDGTPQDGDDSDDDGGDSAVQEQVLDFVLDFGDEKPETDSGVVQHQQQRPPSLDLVMTHFPLVSQLCRPDHWATLGRLVLDRIQPQSAVLARATKTTGEITCDSTAANGATVSPEQDGRLFLQLPAAQSSRELHTSLVSAAVQDLHRAAKLTLSSVGSVVKLLKSVAKECTAQCAFDESHPTVSSKTVAKWSEMLEGIMSEDHSANKDLRSATDLWKSVDRLISVIEQLPMFFFSPSLLSVAAVLLTVISFVADLFACAATSNRCKSLLAAVIDRCASPASRSVMERSRRQALLSSLPALDVLLSHLYGRASDVTAVNSTPSMSAACMAPDLDFFSSAVRLALAHGSADLHLVAFAERFVKAASSASSIHAQTFYMAAAHSSLCAVCEILKIKSVQADRRTIAIDVCKVLIKKLLPQSVRGISAADSVGDEWEQLRRVSGQFVHQSVMVAALASSSKLTKRVALAASAVLPDVLRLLREFYTASALSDGNQGACQRQISLVELSQAILSNSDILGIKLSLEESVFEVLWEVASLHLFGRVENQGKASELACRKCLDDSMSSLLLTVPCSSTLDVWKSTVSQFVTPKSISLEWLRVASLLLPAEMPVEHRLQFSVAMVKLLPLMPKLTAASYSLSPVEMTQFSDRVLSWATSLALHGKMCLSPPLVGTMLFICNSVPLSADADRLHTVCSRTGELIHILLKHHTSAVGSHVAVLIAICHRLMQAIMALSALNIARTKQHSPVSSSRKALQDAAQQADDDATATTTPGEQEEAAVSAEVQALQKCAEAYARMLENIAGRKTYSKYAPYILASYLTYSTRYPMHGPVKSALLAGIYALLSCCGQHELSLLKATSGRPEQELFDPLYADFKKFFKYSGKI
ncbi:uncharacterized protein LOC135808768 isoform X2 [Sycon ciliatum]|uniref:uncharacterized protein LOC135808768 isoform X2 n=1 Tax=Sycon ciliatum TaxID=27933 RepID=UPI0031F632F0